MKLLLKRILPLLVMALGVSLAYYTYATKVEVKRKPKLSQELSVETVKVKPQQFTPTIEAQGVVEPRTTTTLIPRISGEIISVSPNFRPGGFFKQGEVLLALDQTDYKLAMKSAQAELAEARFNFEQEAAQAELAEANWSRLRNNQEASDLALHKPQLARAKASVDSALAKLQRIELDLQRTTIKAPYSGRILEQFVDVGQYVSPGTSLVKIFATDYVEVRLPITDKQRGLLDLPRAYIGETTDKQRVYPKANVKAVLGGREFRWSGHVVRTEANVDKATRQMFVIVQVDNPYQHNQDDKPPLEIGQFAKAEIQSKTFDDVFVLPRTSIQGEDTVMTVNEESRVQRKKVNVLWETTDQLVIKDGLASADQICVTYVPFVSDNAKVKVIASN
ncbi:MAG: efflux RND transporter periplasmic adaptor subunit [Gammaproteobacteria bacterium]|nr:efflux RND transporter periplasmic adaptor subunit [Gammaproteobacteria bacterium]